MLDGTPNFRQPRRMRIAAEQGLELGQGLFTAGGVEGQTPHERRFRSGDPSQLGQGTAGIASAEPGQPPGQAEVPFERRARGDSRVEGEGLFAGIQSGAHLSLSGQGVGEEGGPLGTTRRGRCRRSCQQGLQRVPGGDLRAQLELQPDALDRRCGVPCVSASTHQAVAGADLTRRRVTSQRRENPSLAVDPDQPQAAGGGEGAGEEGIARRALLEGEREAAELSVQTLSQG